MSHDRDMHFQESQPFQSVRPIQSTFTEALLIVSLSIIGFASSDSSLTLDDPAETQAMDALEEGTKYLEEGNVEAARDHYKRSVGIQKSAAALFNLGVSPISCQWMNRDF
jgi:hypothetical protein